jgi:LysM repeat protein
MRKTIGLLLALCVCLVANAQNEKPLDNNVLTYIEKFRDVAKAEMVRTGVPASITLAQGIHETAAGKSELVLKSNNHFGIKCKSSWTGEKVYHDDDARGECFRKYQHAYQSYKDHSDFLRQNQRYAFLFGFQPTDYENWARGLKQAGYATNPQYPQLLIGLVEKYNLNVYTKEVMAAEDSMVWVNDTTLAVFPKQSTREVMVVEKNDEKKQPTQPLQAAMPVAAVETATETVDNEKWSQYSKTVFEKNGAKAIVVEKGTSFLAIAQNNGVSLKNLYEFNDIAGQPLIVEQSYLLLYLQRKKKMGAAKMHMVQAGETLWTVSQDEGIRLDSLAELNALSKSTVLKVGDQLRLQPAK